MCLYLRKCNFSKTFNVWCASAVRLHSVTESAVPKNQHSLALTKYVNQGNLNNNICVKLA